MANVILGGILKRLYTKVYMKKVKNVTEYISIWKQRTEGYTLKLLCSWAHEIMNGFITYFRIFYNKKSFIYL